jgi:hypothetical protein
VQAQADAPVQAQAAAPNLTPAEAAAPVQEKRNSVCLLLIM